MLPSMRDPFVHNDSLFNIANGRAAVWKSIKEEQWNPSGDVQYVLDGSALLHRVPWPRGSTYESVSHLCVRKVAQKHGAAAIVFDGYINYSITKDATHRRRTSDYVGGQCTLQVE